MYLSRAFLNPVSRAVRTDLADVASLHRTVMSMFPDGASKSARKEHGVLHRLDDDARNGRLVLLVQSVAQPDFTPLAAGYLLDLGSDLDLGGAGAFENPAVRAVGEERERIRVGDRFGFRLLANTTRKILTKTGDDGKRRTASGSRYAATRPASAGSRATPRAAGSASKGRRSSRSPPGMGAAAMWCSAVRCSTAFSA